MRRIVPIPRLPVTISWALLSAANWHITSPGVLCSFLYNSNLIWKIKKIVSQQFWSSIWINWSVILLQQEPITLQAWDCVSVVYYGTVLENECWPSHLRRQTANVYLYHVTKFTFTCRLLFIKNTWNSVDLRQTITLNTSFFWLCSMKQLNFRHYTPTVKNYLKQ